MFQHHSHHQHNIPSTVGVTDFTLIRMISTFHVLNPCTGITSGLAPYLLSTPGWSCSYQKDFRSERYSFCSCYCFNFLLFEVSCVLSKICLCHWRISFGPKCFNWLTMIYKVIHRVLTSLYNVPSFFPSQTASLRGTL